MATVLVATTSLTHTHTHGAAFQPYCQFRIVIGQGPLLIMVYGPVFVGDMLTSEVPTMSEMQDVLL